MRYKTLYYNVEPFARELPDDCLQIIADYAWCDKKYENVRNVYQNIKIYKMQVDNCTFYTFVPCCRSMFSFHVVVFPNKYKFACMIHKTPNSDTSYSWSIYEHEFTKVT